MVHFVVSIFVLNSYNSGMNSHFKTFDRETAFLLPPSVDQWLPEDHLARFVVEIVSQLDLTPLKRQYAGRGSEAFHPEMLLSLLFYGYATGVFSSRKLEQATHDSVAFRYIAANTHPDHDTPYGAKTQPIPKIPSIRNLKFLQWTAESRFPVLCNLNVT
jgi:hypothetical protein